MNLACETKKTDHYFVTALQFVGQDFAEPQQENIVLLTTMVIDRIAKWAVKWSKKNKK